MNRNNCLRNEIISSNRRNALDRSFLSVLYSEDNVMPIGQSGRQSLALSQWAVNSGVEYLPFKQRVAGSIPARPTIFFIDN